MLSDVVESAPRFHVAPSKRCFQDVHVGRFLHDAVIYRNSIAEGIDLFEALVGCFCCDMTESFGDCRQMFVECCRQHWQTPYQQACVPQEFTAGYKLAGHLYWWFFRECYHGVHVGGGGQRSLMVELYISVGCVGP